MGGGKRVGAGRHPKPAPTAEERASVVPVIMLGKRKGGGFTGAARFLSARRLAGRVDPRVVREVSVSPPWIRRHFAEEIKMRKNSNSAPEQLQQTNSDVAGNVGPRIDPGLPSGGEAP